MRGGLGIPSSATLKSTVMCIKKFASLGEAQKINPRPGDFVIIEDHRAKLNGGSRPAEGSCFPPELESTKNETCTILRITADKVKVFSCSPQGMKAQSFQRPYGAVLQDI